MVQLDLPEIPLSLKGIKHYLKMASVHDERDPVISYWLRLYALQTGLKFSTKTPKETNFLKKLMDWLEATKKELRDNEAITNNIVAQAHIENWALKVFLYADKNDRAANFGKNVVMSFFTAGLLYDVLTIFGDLTEEAAQKRKYAKWKTAYIHNCLKNNETPIPGPIQEGDENTDFGKYMGEESESTGDLKENEAVNADELINIGITNPTNIEHDETNKGNNEGWSSEQKDSITIRKTEGEVELSIEQMSKAQKFIKWAGSALNYDDVPTAVSNLQKALHLLTTGEELA